MSGIFISYRRDDSGGYAGRLAEELRGRFGQTTVFMDIHDIPAGADFEAHIHRTLDQVQVVLVLIGERWATLTGPDGERRIAAEGDYVRMEIAAALGHSDATVIPVLLEGTVMPAASELPEDLKPLAKRNAVELSNKRWRYDVRQLRTSILAATAKSPLSRLAYTLRRSRKAAAVALGLTTTTVIALGLLIPGASSGGLRIDDIPVSNPVPAFTEGGSAQTKRSKPTVEIKVRNLSKHTVDVTAARITVADVVHIPPCVTAGAVHLTGKYDTVLPLRRGGVVNQQVNQEVPPDRVDRFEIRFDLPESAYGETGEDLWLYRLHVQLLHDGKPKPVDGGYVSLAFRGTPNPAEFGRFWTRDSAARRAELEKQWTAQSVVCTIRQTYPLKRFLARPARRAPELAGLAANLVTDGGVRAREPGPAADVESIVALLHDYERKYSNRDAVGIGALLTADVVRHGLGKGGCGDTNGQGAVIRTYKDQFSTGTGSYRLTGLSHAAIRVNGDQASAKLGYTIAPNGRGSVEFALTRTPQGWLISRIAASC